MIALLLKGSQSRVATYRAQLPLQRATLCRTAHTPVRTLARPSRRSGVVAHAEKNPTGIEENKDRAKIPGLQAFVSGVRCFSSCT
jgi:hypothetical protein